MCFVLIYKNKIGILSTDGEITQHNQPYVLFVLCFAKGSVFMKVDCLYDVFCDLCGRSMSRDYAVGLCDSVETAVKEA